VKAKILNSPEQIFKEVGEKEKGKFPLLQNHTLIALTSGGNPIKEI